MFGRPAEGARTLHKNLILLRVRFRRGLEKPREKMQQSSLVMAVRQGRSAPEKQRLAQSLLGQREEFSIWAALQNSNCVSE